MFESQFSVTAYHIATKMAAVPERVRCPACYTFHTSKPKYKPECSWHPMALGMAGYEEFQEETPYGR